MKWYDIWTFPLAIFEDIRNWFIWKSVVTSQQFKNAAAGIGLNLRLDKLKRIYTVLNLPEELHPPHLHHLRRPYMVNTGLMPLDTLLLELRLSDMAYPTVKELEEPAYLIVISPFSGDVLTTSNVISYIFKLILGYGIFFLTDKIILNFTGSTIFNHITTLLN